MEYYVIVGMEVIGKFTDISSAYKFQDRCKSLYDAPAEVCLRLS